MFLVLCAIDILLLYILSRIITTTLSRFIHSKVRRINVTVWFFSLLLLPGTILHELSHYVTSRILRVRTFGVTLIPKLEGETLRLGSVSIEKADILRRSLIGVAPLLLGLGIIFASLWWVTSRSNFTWWEIVLGGILIFEIANTMFPSKADVGGTVMIFLISLGLLGGLVIWLGNTGNMVLLFGSRDIFRIGAYYLTIILTIDILALVMLMLFSRK